MITKGKGGGYLVVAGGGDVCVTLSLLMCVPCHASELENPWPKTLEHCSIQQSSNAYKGTTPKPFIKPFPADFPVDYAETDVFLRPGRLLCVHEDLQ